MSATKTTPDILDSHLKGVSLRLLWTIIISTVVGCCTVLAVYYNFKAMIELNNVYLKNDIEKIKDRLDRNGIK